MSAVPARLESRPAAPIDGDVPAVGDEEPTQLRSRWRTPALSTVVGSAFVLWGVRLGLQPLQDNSFLTHLATGRIIVDTWHIPRSDPYSFTAHGHPWVVQSWLASLAYGLADRWAGLDGVRVLVTVLVATMAGLTWRLTRPAVGLLGRIAAGALAVAVGSSAWIERPLLFGLIGFALVLLALDADLDPRWLIPVMWVWVNTHGSFPLAFVAIVAVAAGRRLDGHRLTHELRVLGWTAAGTALAAVNPLGPRLLLFPLAVFQHSESFRVIVEWKPPQFDTIGQKLFLVELMVAAALLVRRPRWRIALPLVTFATLALLSARNVSVASLMFVPGMAAACKGLGSIRADRRRPAHLLGIATAAVLAGLFAAVLLPAPDVNLNPYPVQAVDWLDQQGLLDGHVVTLDYVGNFIEARGGPGRRVFIDDRVDMYPTRVIRDMGILLHAAPEWAWVLKRYHADAVLWARRDPLTQVLRASPDWRVAREYAHWVIFVPR